MSKQDFNRFLNKAVNGGAVHSLHIPNQAWMGGDGKSSGANALSLTAENIIPQKDYKEAQIQALKEKVRKASEKIIKHRNEKGFER